MKIVHFAKNIVNGAGRAAYRLHRALLDEGAESLMLVNNKTGFDDTVVGLTGPSMVSKGRFPRLPGDFLNRASDLLPFFIQKERWALLKRKWQPRTLFNMNISFVPMRRLMKYTEGADIVCVHSAESVLSSDMVRKIYELTLAPIVWTLMDIEPVTGGCHFNDGCDRFTNNCGNCPQISNPMEKDISRKIWNQKKRDYDGVPMTLVAVTSNSMEQARQSSLFRDSRIEKIFLSVDETIRNKVDMYVAREALGLPKDKKLILFGCFSLDDKRKGGDYLLNALMKMPEKVDPKTSDFVDSIVLVTMGRKGSFDGTKLPMEWVHLGAVNDDRVVSLVYNACDVFACPSIDDVGPMMINEAFSARTPVVAFDSGVAPDLILSDDAGHVSKHGDTSRFCEGIVKCLFSQTTSSGNPNKVSRLRDSLRPEYQGIKYISLFEELLKKKRVK